jgi:hypothetical protein
MEEDDDVQWDVSQDDAADSSLPWSMGKDLGLSQ